jgi:two-component system, NarL family, response regulator DegU
MSMKKINIAIVDDHAMFREGLIGLLKEFPEFKVMFEASSGKELMEQLKKQAPEIILMDIKMPDMDGIEATEEVKRKYPEIKIIVLTMHNSEEIIYDIIKKGANGFLQKDKSVEQLLDTIYHVIDKNYYFSEQISKTVANGFAIENNKAQALQKIGLTEREIEIVRLMCKDFTTKEIASAVFLSERTVQKHKENIYTKTKTKSPFGIYSFAIEYNLLK